MAPPVRFGILGPLEVRVGDQRIAVGGPRVQAILAVLLLRGGQEVSADTLIDAVWGESAPPTVRTSLQVHISKLRKTLGEHGAADAIRTRGSAYELQMAPEQLDATRFRRAIIEGRESLGANDPERARRRLTEALALWRGVPLTGLDLPGLPAGELRELEDLHDLATTLRFEAELELGRHLEIVPDLMRARAERPLDERLAELAALALFRCGRQADALAELASLRHQLSEQLGMEPGPSVNELEQRILAGDPQLAPPVPPAVEAREMRKTVTVVALRLPTGDPEEVRASTTAVADLLGGVVANLGGWCPPARSGRFLAVFGIPVVHEDDAERAVRTADALGRASAAMGLEARIAVSTGEVLVEVAGADVRLLTHDPVEVADQLARKARGGEVLLGVATQRLAQAIAAVDPSPLLVLDDDEGPLVAYRLLDVAHARATRRLTAPLVGREGELARLREGAQRALAARRPTLLSVLGPAGIGKSRLIAEFTASLGDRVEVAVGHCLPYGRDIGVWPIAQVVRDVAGIPEGGGARSARRRLREFVAAEPDADILAEQLGALVGLADRGPAPDETSWAIRRALEIGARRRPLVVVLEDLQWGDDSLLDLVGYVSSTSTDVPVVFVCSARPELVERRPTWGSAGIDATTIRLEPLDDAETDDLLVRLLGSSELEPPARDRIASAAEGNPLFLEEIVSILIDDGHLHEREGRWEPAGDLTAVPLPPTVKALLEARIDRLPADERALLEVAAIAGRDFGDEDLEALRPDADAGQVAAALDALCRRDLLELQRFSRPGSRWYAFRHILVRDVAYQAIPREIRAADHERYGRALIRRAGERLAEIEEIVGYHLETAFRLRHGLAGDQVRLRALGSLAATHLGVAGRRAFGRDDVAAAASLFGRALDCAGPDDPERGELARLRGAALFDLGTFDEAEEALRGGLEAAERSGDQALRWRLEVERTHVVTYLRPDTQSAAAVLSFADQAIAALTQLGDVAGLARAHRLRGEALSLLGRQEQAIEAFLQGWKLAQVAGDERELALRPQPTGVHGPTPLPLVIRQCERILAESTRPRPETVMRLAFAEALVGHDDEARRRIDEGLVLAHDVAGGFRVSDAEMHAGAALLYLDDPRAAAAHLERAVEGLTEIGERSIRSTAAALLGDALFRLGKVEEADAAAEVSRKTAADDDQASQMAWRQVKAKVLAARGDVPAGIVCIGEAVAIADATDFLTMAAFAHLDASEVWRAAGDADAASRERETALDLLRRKGASERLADRVGSTPTRR